MSAARPPAQPGMGCRATGGGGAAVPCAAPPRPARPGRTAGGDGAGVRECVSHPSPRRSQLITWQSQPRETPDGGPTPPQLGLTRQVSRFQLPLIGD
jgi:hypothetical protein